ncbi:hypothetical protein C8A00DRAFT_16731 [Chaetomidium leptoderma]|uniref:2-dehydropantoate 2-reductase n=1 Tax=Chaetomidium leptoderma TaxID=669021 RepID=A0AAN6ZU18_9PEZI|nr:hypothetical protein C8A00DRAFT_16731 [Chaetomidium leptoderma]
MAVRLPRSKIDAPPVEKPLEDKPPTIKADPAVPAEQEGQGQLGRIQSKVALWDSEERQAHAGVSLPLGKQPLQPSDQIHIMGLDLAGRYIAHTLAGCRTIPPVRYMLHKHYLYREWYGGSKQLTLYRGDISIARRRVVAEYIPEELVEQAEQAELQLKDVIHNLVVTLPASHVVPALGHISDRLDHRSTICLVNDGLGVAEALIDAYFPDELKRPIFLLGHLTTSLGHTDDRFSVSEVRPGRLYLSLFSPQGRVAGQGFDTKRHPPLERTARGTHLIRLLTAMPGLNATGHSMPDFLRYKLPTVVFRTIVDPMAALLDCRYDYLPKNRYARQMMDRMIGELSRVISRLPECRGSNRFRQFTVSSSLRDEVFHKLMRKKRADCKMRVQIRRGWDTDVEFLAGYFVRRGREVQSSVAALDSIMWAVKAKQVVEREKLDGDIPFETTQGGY